MKAVLAIIQAVVAVELLASDAPKVVAIPPTYAVRDLCVTKDGRFRHYGWRMSGGRAERVYIESDDGYCWTREKTASDEDVGAVIKCPWSDWWLGFKWGSDGTLLSVRSKMGPGDTSGIVAATSLRRQELRQMVFLEGRRRCLAAFSDVRIENGGTYRAVVGLSDDDGANWRFVQIPKVSDVPRLSPGDKRPRWYNQGCEPSVVELKDGSLLMALRTSGEHHAFCRSEDGGETWSEPKPDPSFWAANTMPYFHRLRDGRLLFIWNNTQMLPTRDASEYPELDVATLAGKWESAFTNRDALHAAISEDDGKTWRGFREIVLNPIRNAPDFRQLGNFPGEEHDKSVHQTQALELPDGKVLLAIGQNVASRRMVVLDPSWLYEVERVEDFRRGLENVSTHLYVKSLSGGWRGWAGHCAWNRVSGALLVREPDTSAKTVREALQLCRITDPRLVCDRQGVVWNFPAARRGRIEIECRIDGAGFQLALSDHWMNPSDEFNPRHAPACVNVTTAEIPSGEWRSLVCEWNADTVRLCSGDRVLLEKPLRAMPRFGLSYLHLQTLAAGFDAQGSYFRSFKMKTLDNERATKSFE